MEPIEKRRGTIEAQALLAGAKVIVDLVEKGNTMRALGYEPIKQIDESRTLAIGRIRPEDPRNRVLQAMFDRIPGPLLVA
jgi:ATP phosphoribosyltransferase